MTFEDLSAHKLLLFTIKMLLRNIEGSSLLIQINGFNIKMHVYINMHNIHISQLVIIIYLFNTHRMSICAYSQPSVSTGSMSTDSPRAVKTLKKKQFFFLGSSQKAKLEFVMCQQLFTQHYIVLGIISNLEMI